MKNFYKVLPLFMWLLVSSPYIEAASGHTVAESMEDVGEDSEEDERTKWEQAATRAATSWGMTYQAFRAEAEEFLINYKKSHPSLTHSLSVEDLIVLPKPNIEALKENLDKFNKVHGGKYREEIHRFDSNALGSSVKFLVPSHQ